jgi:Sigma-70 region 2
MDITLVVRAQHGDEEAFASLAVGLGDRLHAVAHRILRDTDLAEDATQQALLAIWRSLPQLRDPTRFDAWSYRLLVNACYLEGAPIATSPASSGRGWKTAPRDSRTASWTVCSTRFPRPHSAVQRGRRGGLNE